MKMHLNEKISKNECAELIKINQSMINDLPIPERSTLYSLEPIGVNTPYVESLTSYICRLAKIHNVNVIILLKLLIYPELTSCPSILNGTKGRHFDGFQVNGIGKTTLDFVDILSKLTKRNDLINLTLLNYTSVFSINPKNFICRYKRWCTLCLKESFNNNSPLYEPLIWFLEEIKYCDKHKCSLQDKCWNCSKKIINFFASNTNIGYCPYCSANLADIFGIGIDIDELELTYKDYLLLEYYKHLIETNGSLNEYPTRVGVRNLMDRLEKSKILRPYRSAGEILNLNEPSMKAWFYGNTPSTYFFSILYNLTDTLFVLIIKDVKICNILINRLEQKLKENGHNRKDGNKNRNKITVNEIEVILNEFLLKQDYSIGIQKLAEMNKFCATTARKKFPDLCNRIVKYHREYKKIENEGIRNKIEQLLIFNKDEVYSAKDIAKIINKSPSFFKSNFPDLYSKIINYNKCYNLRRKNKKIYDLKQIIYDAIMDLHQKNIIPSIYRISSYLPNRYIFRGNNELKNFRKNLLLELGYDSVE